MMNYKYILKLIIVFLIANTAIAQQKQHEISITNNAPKIDGKTDDAIWKTATKITDFQNSFPNFGGTPTYKSEVQLAYDNTAFYVLAKMYAPNNLIRRQLTQRDNIFFKDCDNFTIAFDTYLDKQNAFSFTVTAAGVQGDARFSNQESDYSWDAVWMSAAKIEADYWIAELKIPLSAIRFSKKAEQSWGLQLKRFVRHSNETNTWSPEDPNKNGEINQWGLLQGIKNIQPPLRLSFLPYLSGGFRNSPTNSGSKTETLSSGGMDVKWGINESFTVDMTLVPDFAQVQSDNVILNLTPFEVRFDDFRPFFTEGTELFNKAGLFYSRRIGAAPDGVGTVLNIAANDANYEIKKNPGISRLINATKLSGRNRKNLGIGVFNAVTAQMEAVLHNKLLKTDSVIITAPLTNYNVIVIDKALKNRSSITFTNTNALRADNSRNANVSALDLNFFDKKNNFNLSSTFRYSNVWGNQNYDGYTSALRLGKVSGKWQYGYSVAIESDEYDANDVGFLLNNNSVEHNWRASLNFNQPTKKYLRHNYSINLGNTYFYKPYKWQEFSINASSFFLFKNFWDVRTEFVSRPIAFKDYFESRTPGIELNRFSWAYIGIEGSTDSRKKLFSSFNFGGAESAKVKDDPFYQYNVHLRYRFNPKLQTTIDVRHEFDKGQWGYSFRDNVSTIVPGYNDPIIAFRSLKTKTLIASGIYNFTPRMNATIRMRHNWTYVTNRSFHKLLADGSWKDHPFQPNRNRNFNVFNIDMFYTWDFNWGSRLTFGWKNALGSNVSLNPYTYNKYSQNLSNMFSNPHSNEVTLKIVYFLDYLNLKKRK
jgi:hypothetical protein